MRHQAMIKLMKQDSSEKKDLLSHKTKKNNNENEINK